MAASAERAPAGKSSKTWLGLNIGWDDALPDDGEARGARGVKARRGSGAWMGAIGEEEVSLPPEHDDKGENEKQENGKENIPLGADIELHQIG